MAMEPTAVLLIPGFFGYAAFGSDENPVLEYFGGVREHLESILEPPGYFVVTHEPPPTGSINERVASLHDAVKMLLNGTRLPHGREAFRARKIHLVGHSTGGVDARLYANSAFRWAGGPEGSERIDPIKALGKIITLSAPFRGTPITTNIRGDRDAVLEALHILTMLGVFANGQLDDIVIRSLKATPFAVLNAPLALPRALWGGLAPESAIANFAQLVTHKVPAPPSRALPALLLDLVTSKFADEPKVVVDKSFDATGGNGAVSVSVRSRTTMPLAWLNDPRKLFRAFFRARSPSSAVADLAPLVNQKSDPPRRGAPPALLSRELGGSRGLVATQIGRFFNAIESDRQLLDDLAVDAIVPRTDGLEKTDHPRIESYVSVSPPPTWWGSPLELIPRYVYAALYKATDAGGVKGDIPIGPFIGPDCSALLARDRSNDGAVPARSQTLQGKAVGIVLSDHLDLVGSYAGGHGANVMRSGSGFDRARFRALWHDVARRLMSASET